MIGFTGRFDFTDPVGPVFAWSGSSIGIRFAGTGISVRLRPTNPGKTNNWMNVFVDGNEPFSLRVDGDKQYPLASGLQHEGHTVTLVKRTEAMEGELQFLGFVLDDGELSAPPPVQLRKIEFIGDSYTCGYGNEAKVIEDGYKPEQENFSKTYAALTAKAFNADLTAIAWSGKGIYSNYGGDTNGERMPVLYLRTLPERSDSEWDFSRSAPDAVVINLGTNDFSVDIDRGAFESVYTDFVRDVLGRYPNANVFCTIMMDRAVPSVAAVVSSLQAEGYSRIHFLKYSDMDIDRNGIGGDWHPSAKTHAVMAQELITAMKPVLGW